MFMCDGALLSWRWLMEVVNEFPFLGLPACVALALLLSSLSPAMTFFTFTLWFCPPSLWLWGTQLPARVKPRQWQTPPANSCRLLIINRKIEQVWHQNHYSKIYIQCIWVYSVQNVNTKIHTLIYINSPCPSPFKKINIIQSFSKNR